MLTLSITIYAKSIFCGCFLLIFIFRMSLHNLNSYLYICIVMDQYKFHVFTLRLQNYRQYVVLEIVFSRCPG